MAQTGIGGRETFLVEHYRPGLSADELSAWAARVRDTTGEMEQAGKPVRYLRAPIVPTDLVREAYARAGIPFERITAVIPDGTWSERPPTKEER